MRVRKPAGNRPWVDHVAGYIADPVARLRFLKAVAPYLSDQKRGFRLQLKRVFLLIVLAAAAFASFSLVRGPARAGSRTTTQRIERPVAPVVQPKGGGPDVWPVERNARTETFSNGLRVETQFTVATHTRSYLAFPARREQPIQHREAPAGIVFHTTESQQAPFEARENGTLKRIGESLLDYVRRRRCYNFVIDRFGRVFRIVPEEQAANHAGHSIWADENWTYLNLNESFLGVSFEAVTGRPEISPGQMRSAIMLLEMLRSRYHIAAANCVTHAQVSVNPANMRVGYHVDWAAGFPYAALGLPDNYRAALPAMWQFGFESDETFQGAAGPALQIGILNAEYNLAEYAHRAGLDPAAYRKRLRGNYRALLAEVRHAGARESVEPE